MILGTGTGIRTPVPWLRTQRTPLLETLTTTFARQFRGVVVSSNSCTRERTRDFEQSVTTSVTTESSATCPDWRHRLDESARARLRAEQRVLPTRTNVRRAATMRPRPARLWLADTDFEQLERILVLADTVEFHEDAENFLKPAAEQARLKREIERLRRTCGSDSESLAIMEREERELRETFADTDAQRHGIATLNDRPHFSKRRAPLAAQATSDLARRLADFFVLRALTSALPTPPQRRDREQALRVFDECYRLQLLDVKTLSQDELSECCTLFRIHAEDQRARRRALTELQRTWAGRPFHLAYSVLARGRRRYVAALDGYVRADTTDVTLRQMLSTNVDKRSLGDKPLLDFVRDVLHEAARPNYQMVSAVAQNDPLRRLIGLPLHQPRARRSRRRPGPH